MLAHDIARNYFASTLFADNNFSHKNFLHNHFIHNKEKIFNVLVRLLLLLCFFTIAGLFLGKQSWAIEGPGNPGSENQPDQTIYLEADQVDIDNKQKISTYQGNVKLSRGDIIILADKITAKKNKKGLGKLFATGNPVKFNKTQQRTGQNDSGQKEIKGQALEIEYDTEKEIMTLKNEAKLWQSNDQFSGNLIIYNIAQESVTANRGSAKNGRVQVIIHPGNNSPENKLRAND